MCISVQIIEAIALKKEIRWVQGRSYEMNAENVMPRNKSAHPTKDGDGQDGHSPGPTKDGHGPVLPGSFSPVLTHWHAGRKPEWREL